MEATVELMTSQEAQNHFGKFSRKAQRDIVIITNHSEPVFIAIPVRITASIYSFQIILRNYRHCKLASET